MYSGNCIVVTVINDWGKYWTNRVRLTLSFWTLKKLSTPLHMNFLKANCLVMVLGTMVLVERHWNG